MQIIEIDGCVTGGSKYGTSTDVADKALGETIYASFTCTMQNASRSLCQVGVLLLS